MKTRYLLPLLIAALTAVSARNLCAQDPMANWKPSVGDKFVYFQRWEDVTYWNDIPNSTNVDTDTLTMEILNTDSAYNNTYQHVVVVSNSLARHKIYDTTFYYYHPGSNLTSTHPFAVDVGVILCKYCNASYDFSNARDTQMTYGSNPLTVYAFKQYSTINGNPNSSNIIAAQYSPDYKWFYSESSSSYQPSDNDPNSYDESTISSTLISATTVHSKVEEQTAPKNPPMTVRQSADGEVIRASFRPLQSASSLEVFDLLGRKQLVILVAAGVSTAGLPHNSLSPGCYIARLGNDVAKFVVAR